MPSTSLRGSPPSSLPVAVSKMPQILVIKMAGGNGERPAIGRARRPRRPRLPVSCRGQFERTRGLALSGAGWWSLDPLPLPGKATSFPVRRESHAAML